METKQKHTPETDLIANANIYAMVLKDGIESFNQDRYDAYIAGGNMVAYETSAERDRLKEENERLISGNADLRNENEVLQEQYDELSLENTVTKSINSELLEALKAVYSDIDLDKHGSSELNTMVQQAIAKATKV